MRRSSSTAALAILLCGAAAAAGDEVRYCQQNGVTYQETRRTVQQLVPETRMQPCTRTVCREQCTTENRDLVRSWWCPVAEYRYETEWVGRWNPFVEPYPVTRAVPRTRWELKSDVVRVPVVTRRLVPETQTVQMPVTTYRYVPQQVVVSRVPVGPAVAAAPATSSWPAAGALQPTPSVARRDEIGGISRLDKDPAPWGSDAGWQPSPAP